MRFARNSSENASKNAVPWRGAAAGENASDAVAFTVFRRVAALTPRVRIDASVHRLLGGRECESRSQNQLHFEDVRARLMQQTFRRDFGVLKSIFFRPLYR